MNQMHLSKSWRLAKNLARLSLVLVCVQTPFVVLAWSIWPNLALVFKSIADVCILISLFLIALNWSYLKQTVSLKSDKLVLLLVSFVLLNLISGLFGWENFASFAAGMLINLRFVLAFLINYLIAQVEPDWSKKIAKLFMSIALVVVGFAILQLTVLPQDFLANFGYSKQTIMPFMTIDENSSYVRINSTLRGPNPLGALSMIIVSLSASYYFYTKNRRRGLQSLALALMAMPVIYFSYSRSAWLAMAISGLLIVWFSYKKAKTKVTRVLAISLVMLVAVFGLMILLDDNHSLEDEFEHVVLHENDASQNLKSNDEHNSSITKAVNSILNWPLGHGTGSAGSASLFRQQSLIIENQFLLVAYETGVAGMALLIAIMVVILFSLSINRQNWIALGLFSSGLGLIAIGLVLPVFVDSAVAVTWWSLAGAVIGKNQYNKNHGTTEII